MVCFGPDGREKWRTLYVGHYDRWKIYPDGKRERFKGKNVTPAKDSTETLRLRPSIESDRVKIVKQVFGWFSTEDISAQQIARRLNDLKVSPIFAETWHSSIVIGILRNPVYIGLPTWNRRAGANFAEYVDGRVQPVNEAKRGKRRKPADHIQPDKAEFTPIIDGQTWQKTQMKLDAPNGKKPRRAPHTAELWLRPFLVCGHCVKPMHANSRRPLSYVCGSYSWHGKLNPTGCRIHRVHHDVIGKVVADYLAGCAPKIAALLKASKGADLETIRSLLENFTDVHGAYSGVSCDILSFIDDHENGEVSKLLKQGKSFVEIYGLLFERVRPRLEAAIAAKQSDLDKMLDDFRGLPERLRQRAVARMEPLQAEIDELAAQLVDWREPFLNLRAELTARQASLKTAVATVGRDGAERVKSEALRGVVDRIVCHFRHTTTKKGQHNGASILEKVEIYPISAEMTSAGIAMLAKA